MSAEGLTWTALILVALWVAGWLNVRRTQSALLRVAGGRTCPKCARTARRRQMVRVVIDGRVAEGRALNRCPCGEFTMFDASGGAVHVDAPAGKVENQ